MGVYLTQDIETDDGGRIQLDRGDIKVASVKRSCLQALNWLIVSNRGDTANGDAVANLRTFYGELNIPRVHRLMENQIRQALEIQRLFPAGDVQVEVLPVSNNDVAVTARLFGTFIEPDEDLDDVGYGSLGYVFPFQTAQLTRVS